jgi:hypothetical protein
MKEFRWFAAGAAAALLLFAFVTVFGRTPRRTEPSFNCLCPDSTLIELPRSLETEPRK